MFAILEIFVIIKIFQNYDNPIVGYIFILGALIQEFSYLLVAVSNPGIATEIDFDTEGE